MGQDDLLKRKKATEKQRGVAMYLCKTLSGRKNAQIGKVFGISIQGVTNTIRRIRKEKGENRKLDKDIVMIEKNIKGLKCIV